MKMELPQASASNIVPNRLPLRNWNDLGRGSPILACSAVRHGGRGMTARLDVAVRGLFATPVAALEVPDAAAINVQLARLILTRREHTSSAQASNAGGWHSDRDILDWGGPGVSKVIEFAKGIAGPAHRRSSRPTGQPRLESGRLGPTSTQAATRTSRTTILPHSGPEPTTSMMAAAPTTMVWAASSRCSTRAGQDRECMPRR